MPTEQEIKFEIKTPEDLAKFFVYTETKNRTGRNVALKNVSGKSLYSANKQAFDAVFKFSTKFSVDMKAYVRHFVLGLGKSKFDVKNFFADPSTMASYAMALDSEKTKLKIFKYIQTTIKKLTETCIERGYKDVRLYFAELVKSGKLAAYYASGEISQYYLALVKNVEKLVEKLDPISRAEFSEFLSMKDKLAGDAQSAWLFVKSSKLSPISAVNSAISAYNKKGFAS